MGKRIHGLFGSPDIILSSGAKRALNTAELFAKELEFDVKNIHQNDQLYHASLQDIIEVVQGIDEQFETAMLFSHNPGNKSYRILTYRSLCRHENGLCCGTYKGYK